MTIFCPACGKKLQPTREHKAAGGENFAFDCPCSPYHTIFARVWKGFVRSVYFVDPLNFEGVWTGNKIG